MRTTFSLAKLGVAAFMLVSLTSCEDILEQYFPKPTPTTPTFPPLGQDIAFFALSGGTKLDAYSTQNPNTPTGSVSIMGLGSGETLLAIDFRPATGQLYGVSSASRLYVINQNTGVARAVGAGAFTPAVGGNLVGFDFNPTVDRIRLVTSTGQNLRLNPETCTVAATDGVLNGATGATITGSAYTNNVAGAATTALYAINTQNQQLYLVNPPNDGTLVSVGSLNLKISDNGGFDIDARTGTALGLYAVNGKPTLFAINLSTGAARPLAEYAANTRYSGLAIPTQPVAYAITEGNNLYIFNPTTPSVFGITKPITGLGANEFLFGLDFRPANGQLYALASGNKLYTINAATGAATLIGSINAPGGGGFDFDPVTDRIRITNGTANISVNPIDASFIREGDIRAEDGFDLFNINIQAAAYSNNYAGATTTKLYFVNSRSATLLDVFSPNEGLYRRVGNGFSFGPGVDNNGFDIGGMSNTGYGIFTRQGGFPTRFYSIDFEAPGGPIYTEVGNFPVPVQGFTISLGF